MTSTKLLIDPFNAQFTNVLGAPVLSVERMNGGANSQVFKLTADDGSKYVAKIYGSPTADGKDRLSTEFTAFSFLRENGITCVPKPIRSDKSQRCAVFEYIDGVKLSQDEITGDEIRQACLFLVQLSLLSVKPTDPEVSTAAEACFSLDELISNISGRLKRLQDLAMPSPRHEELHKFLSQKFIPTFDIVKSEANDRLADLGINPTRAISQAERVLSPSDFGFHNCVRRPDGQLAYLDFEYFGWDDPAKMLSDFLLHPAMDLTTELKQQFLTELKPLFESRIGLHDRLPILFPLFGLKWCLIILNEFFPEIMAKRQQAHDEQLNEDQLLLTQLKKAEAILDDVARTHHSFLYWGS